VINLGQGYTYAERLKMSIEEASKKKAAKKTVLKETPKKDSKLE